MIVHILRHVAWLAILPCIAAPACSSAPPSAKVFIEATVGAGNEPGNNAAVCQFSVSQQFVIIGTPTAPHPTTVTDGNTQAGAAVHVTCTVSPTGNGFHVQASATVEGLSGGTLSIVGDVSSSGGMGLYANFNNTENGTFDSPASHGGCSVSFNDPALDPMPSGNPIAAGRIWGHLSCPNATKSDQLVDNPDGSTTKIPRTCDAEANFLFENCGT